MLTFAFAISAAFLAAEPAAQKLEFDVASVKQNKSGLRGGDRVTTNIPLGPYDVFRPTGGLFAATNQTLLSYILFAYKVQGGQVRFLVEQAPGWVRSERYDIKARAEGNPTKDEFRLMMQALLAERFHLSIHEETRKVPVFDLVLIKEGETGPGLRPHPADATCPVPGSVEARRKPEDPFPPICGGMELMIETKPGLRKEGARNVSMDVIASAITPLGNLDRPVIDKTGLSGKFDFALEWAPMASRPLSVNTDSQYDSGTDGPSFLEAVKSKLGLKLESGKSDYEVILVDHIEHPTEN